MILSNLKYRPVIHIGLLKMRVIQIKLSKDSICLLEEQNLEKVITFNGINEWNKHTPNKLKEINTSEAFTTKFKEFLSEQNDLHIYNVSFIDLQWKVFLKAK